MSLLNRSFGLLSGRLSGRGASGRLSFNAGAHARNQSGGSSSSTLWSWLAGSQWVSDTVILLRNAVMQLDYVAAQRLKRGNAVASLYNRLYGRDRLVEFLRLFCRRLRQRSRRLVLGSAFIGFYDWTEGVPLGEMRTHCGEIEICNNLIQKTLTCGHCGDRLRIEKAVEGTRYCECQGAPASVYGRRSDETPWTPFIERKDILVWRQEHPSEKGIYIYKMYGKFEDVSAAEFLSVQLDMSEFRLTWDTSTAQCFVLDKDPDSSQDIYYWEVNWPRFFANRDYCCVRQTYTDPETGVTVLTSRSIRHPHCPEKRKCMRVTDYMAVLTVKPLASDMPDQPGIEFSLTAYENPGVQLPESIITWVAIRGMPEYMNNLRSACTLWRTYNNNVNSSSSVTSRGGSASSSSSSSSSSCSVESQSTYGSQPSLGPSAIYA